MMTCTEMKRAHVLPQMILEFVRGIADEQTDSSQTHRGRGSLPERTFPLSTTYNQSNHQDIKPCVTADTGDFFYINLRTLRVFEKSPSTTVLEQSGDFH